MAGGLLLLIFWNLDQIEFWNLHDAILDQQSPVLFNPKVPKRCGGGGGGGGGFCPLVRRWPAISHRIKLK